MPAIVLRLGWLVCVAYSTVPPFWLLIHPHTEYWRSRRSSPYRVLLPMSLGLWAVAALATVSWRKLAFYQNVWMWVPALALFALGIWLYARSSASFSVKQLRGIPEIRAGVMEQRLVTTGIRARVRHPIYLAHLCEMLAWSVGTGLVVCFGLTLYTVITGALMIRAEDAELERRFGEEYRHYRESVPAIIPTFRNVRVSRPPWLLLLLSCFGILPAAALGYAFKHRDHPMLFQHGTPEVAGGRAFAIMNPFRNRSSEVTAERLIHDLHSSDCKSVIASFASDDRICTTVKAGDIANLIWRDDRGSIQVLVYDMSRSRSRLWLVLVRDEGGFEIRQASIMR